MKVFVFAALLALAVASPLSLRKDNPDERGKYYQGDIRLPLPSMNKNGLIDESYRWPNGNVPYIIGASASFSTAQLNDIAKAMSDYSTLTGGCINWVERNGESDYVRFVDAQNDGCWSYVGRLGGLQEINYPDWCLDSYGSTMHEMLHTLGFYHQ
ncbi:hypothetical protein GUF81_14085, partial [Xanthomonas citri pv. citri]|nr:hypothetical protein [Xanthomonas citri pv. citri]